MSFEYFDAHAHTQFAAFKDDYNEVIERALVNKVGLINVGTQKDTSARAVEIAEEYSNGVYPHTKIFRVGVYAAVGLHPIHTYESYYDSQEFEGDRNFVSRSEDFDYDYYKKSASHNKVVAIGECGLDYAAFVRKQRERLQKRASAEVRPMADEGGLSKEEIERIKYKQQEVFIQQIELAHEIKKPLMIHCREAYGDLINILDSKCQILNSQPGIIHFFSGIKEDASKLLNMGFYFTFGGVITFSRDYDDVVRLIPLDRILSETDAPYVSPVPFRGKRNEPVYVIETVKKIAEIKKIPLETIKKQIIENIKIIFRINS